MKIPNRADRGIRWLLLLGLTVPVLVIALYPPSRSSNGKVIRNPVPAAVLNQADHLAVGLAAAITSLAGLAFVLVSGPASWRLTLRFDRILAEQVRERIIKEEENREQKRDIAPEGDSLSVDLGVMPLLALGGAGLVVGGQLIKSIGLSGCLDNLAKAFLFLAGLTMLGEFLAGIVAPVGYLLLTGETGGLSMDWPAEIWIPSLSIGILALIAFSLLILVVELLLDNIVSSAVLGGIKVDLMSAAVAVDAGVVGLIVRLPKRVYVDSVSPIRLWTLGQPASQVIVEVRTEAAAGAGSGELLFPRPGLVQSEVRILSRGRQLLTLVGFTTEVVRLWRIPTNLIAWTGRVLLFGGLMVLFWSLKR